MRRSEFCKVTGITQTTLAAYRRRGALPFDGEHAEPMPADARRWVQYSIHEAAKMIAAQVLTNEQGLGWAEACELLRARKGRGGDSMLVGAIVPGRAPWEWSPHVARVEFREAKGDAPSHMPAAFKLYEGDLGAVFEAAAGHVEGYNARVNFDYQKIEIVSVVSVNLGRAYRIAQVRCEQLGIDPGYTDEPIEGGDG